MTSRTSFLVQATAEMILDATDRWKELWDVVSERSERESLPHMGFARHAAEFWWLTRTIVKVGQFGDVSCRYMEIMPTESLEALHDFMRRYKGM
jgi:hypothetical protein